MPRRAREKCESGIYHIMLRGANRQEIFHDDEDCIRFLETLKRYKEKVQIKLYGWCLMGNHVHLLIEQGNEELSTTMKRIGVSYAWYYNWKYNTTGHLFQDRFKSEKVDNDEYLLTVIRYIHNNPVNAEIVESAQDWKWSSCQEYYGKQSYPIGLLDSKLILYMFSENKNTAIEKFKEFSETGNEDKCLDEERKTRLTDEEARLQIKKIISEYEIPEVKSLPKKQRDEIILKVKGIEGITQRQAARILGISPNLIFKA